ncbi:MAG: hypothetical protein ABF278_09340 [Wenyingzhuangia sp.]|jgi:hypothetical protein|uniref:hypothetical protein n=1 Tax=Wenyingzhuangia sp. TaxID=1964193 RepID=UPI003218FB3A
MQIQGLIYTLPKELKLLVTTFLVVLSVGFYSGITFVENTSGFSTQGVQENYLGNESDEDSEVLKFKKNEKHMLNIIHSHILSMGVIFFLLGGLLSLTKINPTVKKFLMIEPLLSVLVTFTGIYLLWTGVLWMKYIVMFSGILMTASFSASILIVMIQMYKKN